MKKFLFTGVLLLFGATAMPLSAAPLGVGEDSGKIAFARDSFSDGSGAIYVVNPAGSAATRLRIVSRFPDVSWGAPAWSPGGQKLALLGRFDNGTLDHDNRIFVRAPSGRANDVAVVGPGTGAIAWSPSGKWLAIGTGLDAWRLAVVNVSSGKTRLVTRYYGDDPAWSPDGKWICFLYGVGPIREGGEPQWRGLALVHPNGRGFRRVALGFNPAWSPDGRRISFTRNGLGIWVIAADGSHQRRLTTRADSEPAWSPSGSQIVFTRSSGFRNDLWIMRRDGSHQVRLIGHGYSASWQPQR
jgi:Tol biopolymer transport system component